MTTEWYYSRDGQQHGPFPYVVLKAMARKGDLLPTDELREGAAGQWRQASDFPDLFVTIEPRSAFSAPSSLKGLTMALGIEPAKPGQDSLLGCDIGGVTIARLIAEGGMGRVYEGKQDKPNRTVAVKVMRPGLTSPSILKRFEYEAEVLGRLQHPGIAHIYSVGVHRMGNATVPYFVMEYIADARTLTQYADDLKLPTRQRLDLFRSVCEAVAHGHQKGVIHRDLKPSNILVDATGQPKVIDFGVARATDSDMALTTMQTDVGQLIGTLQYMSPEQFDADPNDIDVRSDVYALGVILYELLAGKMPYDVKKKAIYEVMRIVKEEEPTPLSSFNRALKGDVAVIAGKCLEKERGRRYSSASELGSDVGRYLAGDAISASAPSFVDGLFRLARKHRGAALAVAGVFTSLVLAVVGISVFAGRAEFARQQEEAARTLADSATKSAEDSLLSARAAEQAATREKNQAQLNLYDSYIIQMELLLERGRYQIFDQLYRQTTESIEEVPSPFELACLSQMRDQSVVAFEHDQPVRKVAFARDGREVIAATFSNSLQFWDPVQIKLLGSLKDLGSSEFVISGDGSRLAVGGFETCTVFDTAGRNLIAKFSTGNGRTENLALSEDGLLMATFSGQEKTLRLWESATGKLLFAVKDCSGVENMEFSPDGKWLLVTHGSGNCMHQVLDVTSGKSVATLGPILPQTALPHDRGLLRKAPVAQLRRNANGFWAATGNYRNGLFALARFDGVAVVHKYDGSVAAEVPVCQGPALAVAYSPDGKFLAAAGIDGTIGVWEAERYEPIWTVRPSGSPMTCITWSPDSLILATGSSDGNCRVWDAKTGAERIAIAGTGSGIVTVQFSPAGDYLAIAAADGTLQLLTPETGDVSQVLRTKRFPAAIQFAENQAMALDVCALSVEGPTAFDVESGKAASLSAGALKTGVASDDGKCFAFSDAHGLSVFHASGIPSGRYHETNIVPGSIKFSPDGLSIACTRDADLLVIRGATTELRRGHGRTINSLAFSPDGKWIVTGSADRTVRLWQTDDDLSNFMHRRSCAVDNFAFSNDGERLITGSEGDPVVHVWDVGTRELIAALQLDGNGSTAVACSPVGPQVAALSQTGTACLWDGDTADVIWSFRSGVPAERFSEITFSPDGNVVALQIHGHKTTFLDAGTGASIAVIAATHERPTRVRFSPDSKRVVLSGPKPAIMDVRTGQQLVALGESAGEASADVVEYSPDGRLVVTAGAHVRVWDAGTGRLVARLETGRAQFVEGQAAFSADGNYLATWYYEKGLQLWNAEFAEVALMGFDRGSILNVPCQAVCFAPARGVFAIYGRGGEIGLWKMSSRRELFSLGTGNGQVEFNQPGSLLAQKAGYSLRLWGEANATVFERRLAQRAIRERLEAQVSSWMEGGPRAAVDKLRDTKPTLSPEEYRVACNLILMHATGVQSGQPPARPPGAVRLAPKSH